MAEYIDREEVLRALNKNSITQKITVVDSTSVYDTVKNIPAADVAEVRHGEWIESQWRRKGMDVDYCGNPAPQYFCSLCQRDAYSCEPYCHCGAKMDEKGGDGK